MSSRRNKKPRVSKNMRKAIRDETKSVLNQDLEKKFKDTDTDPTAIPNGGFTTYLNAIGGGPQIDQRLGRIIRAVKLECKGTFSLPATATEPHPVRMILYRDMNTENLPSVVDEVLESGTYRTMQQLEYNNMPRFNILYDKRYMLIPDTEKSSINFQFTINRNMIIHFQGNGDGSYAKGQLCLGFVSDTTDLNVNPAVRFACRLWYTDA